MKFLGWVCYACQQQYSFKKSKIDKGLPEKCSCGEGIFLRVYKSSPDEMYSDRKEENVDNHPFDWHAEGSYGLDGYGYSPPGYNR